MLSLSAPRRRARSVLLVIAAAAIVVTLAACYPITTSPYNQFTLFGDATPPTKAVTDAKSVELGVRFKASKNGAVLGVRFYKGTGNTGTHTGTLWTNTGTKLASVTFEDETATGWQTAAFANQVNITAGTTYVVSYHAPVGRYAHGTGWFTSAHTNGPLTAPASTASNPNSVFAYSSSVVFPTSTNPGSNYYVEPVFTDLTMAVGEPATTVKPTTTTARPTTTTTTAPPASGSYPTPQSTGWSRTGVALSAYTGPSTITTAGTVIDGKDITSCIYVRASNVTIKRSRIACQGDYGLMQQSGTNLRVEDTEITSRSSTQLVDRAVSLNNGATLLRVHVHGTQRGIAIVGDNITIQDSWVGGNTNGTSAHTSAIGAWGGADNVKLLHNTLRTEKGTNASSSISVYPESAGNNDWIVDNNLLSSGGGYVLYEGTSPGYPSNQRFTFTNNRFNTDNYPEGGSYGPVASWDKIAGNVWSNNTWYDKRPTTSTYQNKDGKPVNP